MHDAACCSKKEVPFSLNSRLASLDISHGVTCNLFYTSLLNLLIAQNPIERIWTDHDHLATGTTPIVTGSAVVINCQFNEILIPTMVRWYRNGELLTENSSIKDNIAYLSIPVFTESALYQCHVVNEYTSGYASIHLCNQSRGTYVQRGL